MNFQCVNFWIKCGFSPQRDLTFILIFQLFAKPAVKMEAFAMVLTIVPVLRALKALNAKMTLTNVLLDPVFINVQRTPFVSINLDGITANVGRDFELTRIRW